MAGQSFRNHVAGAATGVRMTDYNLYDWDTWASTDYTSGMNLANNGQLHFTWNFAATTGPSFPQIRDLSRLQCVNTALVDPQAEAIVDATTDPGTALNTGMAATIRFLGEFVFSSGMTLVAGHYTDFSGSYPSMEEPPDDNDYNYVVELNPTPPDTSGYTAETFDIVYPVDIGDYNPELRHSISLNVGKRVGSSSFDTQWSFDGTFTDQTAFDNATSFNFPANRLMAPLTVYYRWRSTGTGPSWAVNTSTVCHFHN